MNNTKIEWTERTWNPASGCERITEGCKFCYAHQIAEDKRGTRAFPQGFDLTLRPHKLKEPERIKEPTLIFVNSMSDLFWDEIPLGFRDEVIDMMEATPRHTYQVLTKRPRSMLEYSDRRPFPSNVWAGVTIESGRLVEDRLELLKQVDARVRFISAEPLLSPFPDSLNLDGVHWVITGGESGRHLYNEKVCTRRALVRKVGRDWIPRPDRIPWIRHIRDICAAQGIAFFHKQWGGPYAKSGGSRLDGELWKEYPEDFHVAGRTRMENGSRESR